MSIILQIDRFPEGMRQKIESFAPHDQRQGKLVSLVFKDGTRILNTYIIDEKTTKDDFEEIKDRFQDMSDVVRQGWTMKESEKQWHDPENKEWWKE